MQNNLSSRSKFSGYNAMYYQKHKINLMVLC
jgi:hypothetical protein